MKFMKVDEMYDVLIEDLELDEREDVTNVHNVGVECRMGHHNLVDHGAKRGNIYVTNLFQWVLQAAIDVKNAGIRNCEIRFDMSIKIMGYYNCKEELQELCERHVLETDFQYRVTWSDMNSGRSSV